MTYLVLRLLIIITPVISQGLDRGVPNRTTTFRQLCLKSPVIVGEPIMAIATEHKYRLRNCYCKFQMEKPNNILPRPGNRTQDVLSSRVCDHYSNEAVASMPANLSLQMSTLLHKVFLLVLSLYYSCDLQM